MPSFCWPSASRTLWEQVIAAVIVLGGLENRTSSSEWWRLSGAFIFGRCGVQKRRDSSAVVGRSQDGGAIPAGRVGPEALPSFLGVRKNVVSFHGHKLGKPLYGGIVREQSTAAASLVSRTCWSHQLPALLRRSLHTRVTLLSVENTSGDRLSFCWGDSEAC